MPTSRKEILGVLAAVIVLLPATQRSNAAESHGGRNGYVVLTDLAESDPYFGAARRLQKQRSARLIRFPSGKITKASDPIRRVHPAFVAIVVRPETLDVNFAYEVLELAVNVDNDPFTDFAYGFITGATAGEALGLVERTILAEAGTAPSNGRLVAFGPTSTPQADKGNAFEWLPAWSRKRIEHRPGRFPRTNLTDLAAADVIRFWGHGRPDGVEGSLSWSDLNGIDIRARAVFAGPCFSAVTGRYYGARSGSSELEARWVDADKSLGLRFLSRGALAYFGALQEDRCINAGQEMEHALTSGQAVGMTLKHTQDRIAMAEPNGAMSFTRFQAGAPPPTEKGLEAQLRLAAARILLGDPAFRAFGDRVRPGVDVEVQSTKAGLAVEVAIAEPRIRSTFVNAFSDDLCTCGTDNDTLHVRAGLPKTAGAIQGVRHGALPPALESVKHGAVRWREENWGEERYLHIQMDFKHGALAKVASGTTVRFDVETTASGRLRPAVR